MKIRHLIFFAIVLAIGIGFFVLRPQVSLTRLAAQIYSSPKAPFTFQFPEGWAVDEKGTSGTLVLFVNSAPDHEGDFPLPASINILSEPLQGLSREEYIRTSKRNLQQYSSDYTITKDSAILLAGRDAHVFEAGFTSQGHAIRNRQLLVFAGDTVYIITGTSLASTWDSHRQVIEDSLQTFAIK